MHALSSSQRHNHTVICPAKCEQAEHAEGVQGVILLETKQRELLATDCEHEQLRCTCIDWPKQQLCKALTITLSTAVSTAKRLTSDHRNTSQFSNGPPYSICGTSTTTFVHSNSVSYKSLLGTRYRVSYRSWPRLAAMFSYPCAKNGPRTSTSTRITVPPCMRCTVDAHASMMGNCLRWICTGMWSTSTV